MMGYSRRAIVALLLLSILIAVCAAAPTGYEDLANDLLAYDEDPVDIAENEPHEQKRAVFRMGKRAMMRFGKRAVMRFGKRSVFRLG